MKKLTLANITTSAAAKIKSGTFQHLMDAYEEGFESVINSLIGESLDSSKYYILSGCVNSGSGNNYIISAGVVYNAGSGDFYIVPSATVTRTGANVISLVITSAYRTGTNFDPVTFTDGSTHNMHRDDTAIWTDTATLGAKDFVNMVTILPTKQTLTPTADYTATTTLYARKNRDGLVTLEGLVTCGATAAIVTKPILTLPVGYRPAINKFYTAQFYLAGVWQHGLISISTAGVILPINMSGVALSGYQINLECLAPFYNN